MTRLVQFNYPLNEQFYLYAYSGYSAWDKYNFYFREDYSEVQKKIIFKTYSADNHTLIPFYIGSLINLHSNNFFTFYINIEVGYSYLSYNNYNHCKSITPHTEEVLGYYADEAFKKEITENLFCRGIGTGISHSMGESLKLIIFLNLTVI